jgi:hypothetical protein
MCSSQMGVDATEARFSEEVAFTDKDRCGELDLPMASMHIIA